MPNEKQGLFPKTDNVRQTTSLHAQKEERSSAKNLFFVIIGLLLVLAFARSSCENIRVTNSDGVGYPGALH